MFLHGAEPALQNVGDLTVELAFHDPEKDLGFALGKLGKMLAEQDGRELGAAAAGLDPGAGDVGTEEVERIALPFGKVRPSSCDGKNGEAGRAGAR